MRLCSQTLHCWILYFYFSFVWRPAPMAHSYRLELATWGYQVQIPVGTDICHTEVVHTVLQTVQRHGVYSAVYGTVHYKEPLMSFEIRVGHSPGVGLPLLWLCRKRRKAIFTYSHSFEAQNKTFPLIKTRSKYSIPPRRIELLSLSHDEIGLWPPSFSC